MRFCFLLVGMIGVNGVQELRAPSRGVFSESLGFLGFPPSDIVPLHQLLLSTSFIRTSEASVCPTTCIQSLHLVHLPRCTALLLFGLPCSRRTPWVLFVTAWTDDTQGRIS